MTRQQMKALAKQKLKGNWGIALATIIVASLITGATSSAFGILELIVIGPLMVGLSCVFLNIFRNGSAKFEDMFHGFVNKFFNNFVTGLLVTVFEVLWSLLFVIPGIVKHYAYAMTFFIQYDHPEMTETDAITESRKMMYGHKMELFILDLSFLGWYLLAALTFGLLLLYVAPYHKAAHTAFYENLLATSSASSSASSTSSASSGITSAGAISAASTSASVDADAETTVVDEADTSDASDAAEAETSDIEELNNSPFGQNTNRID